MKDKITFKKFIWAIIGFIVIAFIIVPIGETLINQSRYKNPNQALVEVSNDDFDMKINKFVAAGRDGFVNVDITKKNDKWKYAEVQVIDKDGYIIHREYVDLSDIKEGEKVNVDFAFKGEDATRLNIVGADEKKEPATILNRFKKTIKESGIYKEIEKQYNKHLKDRLNIDFDGLKEKVAELPGWIKGLFSQISAAYSAMHPGLRGLILIAIGALML